MPPCHACDDSRRCPRCEGAKELRGLFGDLRCETCWGHGYCRACAEPWWVHTYRCPACAAYPGDVVTGIHRDMPVMNGLEFLRQRGSYPSWRTPRSS